MNFCKVLLFIFVFVGINLWVGPIDKVRKIPSTPWAEKETFKEQLISTKPEIVLIGNSMLGWGVDSTQLSKLLGLKVVKFARGGAASAWWYLVFKNVVTSVEIPPRVVCIFFRDSFLTKPRYRTRGNYKESIEGMANHDEPFLDSLVYEPIGFEKYLNKIPLYFKRNDISNFIDNTIKNIFTVRLLELDSGDPEKSISSVFDDSNLDQIRLDAEQIKAETLEKAKQQINFKDQLSSSFLPAMLDIAKENDIHIVFVRIKRKRDLIYNEELVSFQPYIEDLSQYFKKNKIPFIDFTYDDRIKYYHYKTGDHLDPKVGKPFFTIILADKLQQIVDNNIVLSASK